MAAPSLVEGDILLCTNEGLLNGQQIVNTFTYTVHIVSPDTKTLDDAATAFKVGIVPALNSTMTATWLQSRVSVRRIGPNPTTTLFYTAPTVASIAGVATPGQLAGVISKRTYVKGPKGRGRVFIPGFPTTFIVDGTFTAAAKASFGPWTSFVNAVLPMGALGSGLIPVVYNRKTGATTVVQYTSLNPLPKTQKRRVIGVGK